MKLRLRFAVLPALLLLVCGGAAQAQTKSLADLLAGGSIQSGDKIFDNWRLFSSVGNGADAPKADEIFITSIFGNTLSPGILIQSGKWNVDQNQTIDTTFTYDVHTANGLPWIDDAEMELLSYATDGDSNIHITESLVDSSHHSVANLLVEAPHGPTLDHHVFDPVSFLTVSKDISLEGHSGHASLSTFDQRFSQVPEANASTFGVAVLCSGALLAFRQRRRASAH